MYDSELYLVELPSAWFTGASTRLIYAPRIVWGAHHLMCFRFLKYWYEGSYGRAWKFWYSSDLTRAYTQHSISCRESEAIGSVTSITSLYSIEAISIIEFKFTFMLVTCASCTGVYLAGMHVSISFQESALLIFIFHSADCWLSKNAVSGICNLQGRRKVRQ